MPESGLDDAEQLFTRIQTVDLEPRRSAGAGRLRLSAGLAELRRPTTTRSSLFERADRALYEAKEAGKGRSIAASA